jgi:hypothetical protein
MGGCIPFFHRLQVDGQVDPLLLLASDPSRLRFLSRRVCAPAQGRAVNQAIRPEPERREGPRSRVALGCGLQGSAEVGLGGDRVAGTLAPPAAYGWRAKSGGEEGAEGCEYI